MKKDTSDKLFNLFLHQDRYIVEEFGMTIIGIVALIFAFYSKNDFNQQLIISLIGLFASIIILLHIYGARQEKENIMHKLKEIDPNIVQAIEEIVAWRSRGINRYIYYPVTRLMLYFLIFITYYWLKNILILILQQSDNLFYLDYIIGSCLILSLIYQRYVDIKRVRASSSL